MDKTNLVLVVGDVPARLYKDAQFDLRRDGIPTKVVRMTEEEWCFYPVNWTLEQLEAAAMSFDEAETAADEAEERNLFTPPWNLDIMSRLSDDVALAPGSRLVFSPLKVATESHELGIEVSESSIATGQIIEANFVTETSTIKAVVMTEKAYMARIDTGESCLDLWLDNMPEDTRRYVVRPDGKLEIV